MNEQMMRWIEEHAQQMWYDVIYNSEGLVDDEAHATEVDLNCN